MQEITGNQLNTRLVSAPKLYTFNNKSGFNKDEVGSSVENYIRTLFYPDQGVTREVEFRGNRIPVYQTSSLRLNFLASSSVSLTAGDFSTKTSTLTASITDPYSGSGAIELSTGYAEMETYKSLSGSLYASGWFRSDDVTEFYINSETSSISNDWTFRIVDITTPTAIDSVRFESTGSLQMYEPRLYKESHSLYAPSINSEYDERSYIYHRSSSFNEAPNGIEPESFRLQYNETDVLTDDGEGNIIHNSDIVGNIFYHNGYVVLDDRFYLKKENIPISNIYSNSGFVDITYNSVVEMIKTSINVLLESDNYDFSFNPNYNELSPLFLNHIQIYNENSEVIMVGNLSKNIEVNNDIYLILEMLEDA